MLYKTPWLVGLEESEEREARLLREQAAVGGGGGVPTGAMCMFPVDQNETMAWEWNEQAGLKARRGICPRRTAERPIAASSVVIYWSLGLREGWKAAH